MASHLMGPKPPHETLRRADGETIAYNSQPANLQRGSAPGVVFLHGLMSDRGGTKAQVLADHCARKGYSFVRFDMFGHGDSSGRFEDGGISRWTEDCLAVLDEVTAGPQILVGSSMGGWVMIKAALARSARIAGLVGIAPGPDFTQDLMWPGLTPAQQRDLMRDGVIEVPSEYDDGPYRISRHMIEDGARNMVLGAEIPIRCPVRLLQGQKDTAIPWQRALYLADKLTASDVEVLLIKDGDHRLSRPGDLAHLCAAVDDLAGRSAA